MIRPGLLTASTSKADHFGMSAVCVLVWDWFCIFLAPFRCRSFWSLRRCFPLVVTVGYDWRRRAHPQGRNAVEELQTCAMWLAWTMKTERGKLDLGFSAEMERRGIEAEAFMPFFKKGIGR